jgi:hypothetical protein
MNKKGFSLVEVLIVSFFLVLLVVAVVTSGVEMRSVFQATGTSVALQQEARLAMNSIVSDLRGTSGSRITIAKDTPVSGSDRLRYELPLDMNSDGVPDLVGGSVMWDPRYYTIEVQDNSGNLQLVKYKQYETPEVIAGNIKSISFEDYNDDSSLYLAEVRIILELEKTEADGRTNSMVLTSTVNMRI